MEGDKAEIAQLVEEFDFGLDVFHFDLILMDFLLFTFTNVIPSVLNFHFLRKRKN